MNNSIIHSDSFTFHHIGSLTSDIDSAERAFSILGFIFTKRIFDPIQAVDLSFGKNSSGILIELVQPQKDSQVEKLLKRNGSGPYHICFEVDSISKQEKQLKQNGFICVKKPQKAIAFGNRLVSFYFSSIHGLVELLEK